MAKTVQNILETAKNEHNILLQTEDFREKMFHDILTLIFNNSRKN